MQNPIAHVVLRGGWNAFEDSVYGSDTAQILRRFILFSIRLYFVMYWALMQLSLAVFTPSHVLVL